MPTKSTADGLIRNRNLAPEAVWQERDRHEATASRAQAVARLTESSTRSASVEALELIAQNGLVARSATLPRVQWSLKRYAGDPYRLTNVGDLAADAVRVDTDEALPVDYVEGAQACDLEKRCRS